MPPPSSPPSLRFLECPICLEFTNQPMRLAHVREPPGDCGIVLCPACFAQWRVVTHIGSTCPKCRGEVFTLGSEGPDRLLQRLIADLPGAPAAASTATAATDSSSPSAYPNGIP